MLFHWYLSYHWYQWRPFLSPLTPMESICEYWTTLTTLPWWSRRRRETGLFGVVAKTWVRVFNFHFNQVCCVYKPTFCRLSFLNCPCFLWGKLDFQALLSKLTSLNVSMFSCHRVKVHLGKQPTVSELDMGQNFPTSQINVSRQKIWTPIFQLCVFSSLFSLEYRMNETH